MMKTASEDKAYRVGNLTGHNWLQFQIRLSDAETEAMTCRLADMQRITNQLEGEI